MRSGLNFTMILMSESFGTTFLCNCLMLFFMAFDTSGSLPLLYSPAWFITAIWLLLVTTDMPLKPKFLWFRYEYPINKNMTITDAPKPARDALRSGFIIISLKTQNADISGNR